MAQRPHVPQFGNWESGENVPYTVFFDKARKGRNGGVMINPNDPRENPDMFPDAAPPPQAPPSKFRTFPEEPIARGAIKPAHERRVSREGGDVRQFTESPARNDIMGFRTANEPSTHQRQGGRITSSARTSRRSGGTEHSVDRSPLHPQYQARVSGRGGASPAWEGKSLYENSHNNPGRNRLRPINGDESRDRGAAVPKFGDWDETNPSSADGYSDIFNKVREEKKYNGGPEKVSSTDVEPSHTNLRSQKNASDPVRCCFL